MVGVLVVLTISGAVQLSSSEPLRQRAQFDADTVSTLGNAECVKVLALSKDETWLLVETSDEKVGWVHTAVVQPQNADASAAVPIGVGCQIAAKRQAALRRKPKRKSPKTAGISSRDLLWVEATDKSGKWLLVETENHVRGWLARRDARLRPGAAQSLSDDGLLARGTVVHGRLDKTAVYDAPEIDTRRGEFGSQMELSVLASRGRWVLVESRRGGWGWVRAEDLEQIGAAREENLSAPSPARETLADEAPAPGKKSIRFKGDIRSTVAIPSEGFAKPNTGEPTGIIAIRGHVQKSLGNWTLGGFARFTFSQNKIKQGQAFDARLSASYTFNDVVAFTSHAGYTLSQAESTPEERGLILDAQNGPVALVGLRFKLGMFSYEPRVINRLTNSILGGQRKLAHQVAGENEFAARFTPHFGLFVQHTVTRLETSELKHQYAGGLEVVF